MIIELERFLRAAQEGNITKTAEKIFITQSALTQSIKRLEKSLGTKLFIQKGKHLQLTDDGKDVQIIAGKIIQLWHNAKDPELRSSLKQTWSIGMFDNAALRLGSYIQKQIQNNSFALELTIESSSSLLSKLTLGTLDAAIIVTSQKKVLPKHLTLVQVFSEELIPVSSKLFTGPLDSIPFIFYNKDSHTREQTDAVFERRNSKLTVFAESTSTTFMKELAVLGSGVALLPKNFVQTELQQEILKRQTLQQKWKRTYGLFINEASTYTKSHPFVLELLQEIKRTT